MIRADEKFLLLLHGYDHRKLAEHSATIYGVWADWRLAYMNDAWFRFAEANGGAQIATQWGLNARLERALPPDLLQFYRRAYSQCLLHHQTWAHDYECSSAELHRRFHQVVYPLGQQEGLLIVNSLIVELPHESQRRLTEAPSISQYVNGDGLLHQCAHCRAMKRRQPGEQWDWIPEWVRSPQPNTSHRLCPGCLGYYQSLIIA